MAYWYCEICAWTVPALPGDDEPAYCDGHDETDDITLGTAWSLHEQCKFCGRDYEVGALVCPKFKAPTSDEAFEDQPTPPLRAQSPGCGGCFSQGCLISCLTIASVSSIILYRFNKSSAKGR